MRGKTEISTTPKNQNLPPWEHDSWQREPGDKGSSGLTGGRAQTAHRQALFILYVMYIERFMPPQTWQLPYAVTSIPESIGHHFQSFVHRNFAGSSEFCLLGSALPSLTILGRQRQTPQQLCHGLPERMMNYARNI